MRIKMSVVGLLLTLPMAASGQEAKPAEVVVARVGEQMVAQSLELVGAVDFDRVSNVASEVRGLIERHVVREGARVAKGAELVFLNTDFTRKDIEITHSEREEVEAELEKAAKNLVRLESLMQSNATSRRAYEETLYTHQSLSKKLDMLTGRIDRLQLSLDKSVIRAPFAGVILERFREIGEWTAPENPVFRIASTEDVFVKVALSEELLKYQRPGEAVPVYVPALDRHVEGVIDSVVPVADVRTKNVFVKIKIAYQPGMVQNLSSQVSMPASEKRKLRTFARDALVRQKGREFVYTVEDGKAKLLPVNVVTRQGSWIAVADEDITPGMAVVVDGNDRLKPDQAIKVIGERS